MISKTPEPPYFAVIFTSTRTEGDHGYSAASNRMMKLAEQQAGLPELKEIMDFIQAS